MSEKRDDRQGMSNPQPEQERFIVTPLITLDRHNDPKDERVKLTGFMHEVEDAGDMGAFDTLCALDSDVFAVSDDMVEWRERG